MTEMKFFFYGSMTEGLVHFHRIKDFVTSCQPAKIQGKAYRLKVGYPVVIDEGEDFIPGQLVELRASNLLWALLDEFHGINSADEIKSLHFRRQRAVHLESSEEQAWVYFLNPKKLPTTAKLIPNGDWETVLQQEPPLVDQLTESQRNYILRLGQVTGREIIPIDLSLYRELMNLEMIVDKGRRLALSKSGHEVFRYLA